jgi:hypothetical protein
MGCDGRDFKADLFDLKKIFCLLKQQTYFVLIVDQQILDWDRDQL